MYVYLHAQGIVYIGCECETIQETRRGKGRPKKRIELKGVLD